MEQRQFKVLLADDICMELEIEKTFLQRGGFEVITASNGSTAIELAIAEHPALIILDQVMPDLTGIEVCRALKARDETRDIPIVITSGVNRPDIEEACTDAGAHAFVSKSLGREQLLRTAALILQVPERLQTRVTVLFTLAGVVGAKESLGRGVDLSESGVRLETNVPYEPGTTFHVRFLLPEERAELKASARLVRTVERSERSYILTLEFADMTPPDRARLNQYLDRTLSVR